MVAFLKEIREDSADVAGRDGGEVRALVDGGVCGGPVGEVDDGAGLGFLYHAAERGDESVWGGGILDGKKKDAAEAGVVDECGENRRGACVGGWHISVSLTGCVVGGRVEREGRNDAVRGLRGDVLRVVEVGEDPGGVEVWAEEPSAYCSDEAG